MHDSSKRRRNPSLWSGLAISVATTLLMLFAIEKAIETFFPPPYDWDSRLIFFSEGNVVQNRPWGGFTYRPNVNISTRTVYITDRKLPTLVDEYSYQISTNSEGLVQLSEINRTTPSIIFLGDSYTEGQGAPPWFYELERRWKDPSLQIINGGIFGTGFESWQHLYSDLASRANIKKIVVIFISSDWTRPVFKISKHDLDCIERAALCNGGKNDFFGLPQNPAAAQAEIRRIALERINYIEQKNRDKNFVKASAIYQRLLHPIYAHWRPLAIEQEQFEKSKNSIGGMADAVGKENILFIQLPQKDELGGEPVGFGKPGQSFIKQSGFAFVDGAKECQLTIDDFHVHDGHPNSAGYRKIVNCVERSVRAALPSSPTGTKEGPSQVSHHGDR